MKRVIPVFYLFMSLVVGLSGCMDSNENQDEEKIAENETAIQAYIKTDSSGSSFAKDSSGLYTLPESQIRLANV